MRRSRTFPPVTVPTASVEPLLQQVFAWLDGFGAPRPDTVRVWRRHDGGVTIRAFSRTPDGRRVSAAVKVTR